MATLGPFRLVEPIARGGMAEVWRGVHVGQNVPVAVKVMTGQLARLDRYRAQFRNEVRAMARLAHPGVICVLDHGEIDALADDPRLPPGAPYLVMELATGGSLSGLRQPPPWTALRQILAELLDALAHAHARGVVHRDVKPANVLLCGPNDLRPGLKLTDFGIAHALDLQPARNPDDDRSGTLHYMAPEQLLGQWRDQGPWTDLYALGCLAHRLARGLPPYAGRTGDDLVRCHLETPAPRIERKDVPQGFVDWVLRLLEKDPRERFQCAADAAAALWELGDVAEAARARLGHEESTVAVRPWRPGPPKIPSTWERPRTPSPPALVGAGLGLYGLRTVPFVGRTDERTALWKALRRVHREGRAELALVTGPAGIGKSRLVEVVAQRAAEVGAATVLRATSDRSGARGSALARLLERLLRTSGLDRDAVTARIAAKMETREDAWEVAALVDVVSPGLPIGGPGRRPPGAGVRDGRERHAAFRRLLSVLCRQRPVLLWLDDVLGDEDALGLARSLVETRDLQRLPVLVVLAARDEDAGDGADVADVAEDVLKGADVLRIRLGPLAPEEHHALVRELLVLDETFAARVEERTAGHPMFAVELVRDQILRGRLRAGAAGFRLPPGEVPVLPDDLHAVWSSRVERLLDGLPGDAGAWLERAAVLGVDVQQGEWEEVCGLRALAEGRVHDADRLAAYRALSAGLDALTDRLRASRLVEETADGFQFRFRILRESLERRARDGGRWVAHHRASAAMLARRREEDAAPRTAERLGRHRFAAGEWAGALEPLLDGAREASRTVGHRGALDLLALYEEAMTALGVPEADPRWGLLGNERTDLLLRGGDLVAGLASVERTVAAARRYRWDEVYRSALAMRGQALRFTSGAEAAAPVFEELLSLALAAGDDERRADALLGLSAVAAMRRDVLRALALAEEAARLAEARRDELQLGQALRAIGDHAIHHADLDRARDAFLRAGEVAERAGSRGGLSVALNGLGHVHRLAGDLDAAEEAYAKALAIMESLGEGNVVVVRFYLAVVAWMRGDAEIARDDLEALLERLAPRGWRRLAVGARAVLVACAAEVADWGAFDLHLADLEDVPESPELADEDVAGPLEKAGDAAWRRGQRDRARQAWSLAVGVWRALGRDDLARGIEARLR